MDSIERLVEKVSGLDSDDIGLVYSLSEKYDEESVELSRQHSLAKTPQADSWIERASSSGLPDYISRVAQEFVKKGMTTGHAIAAAITQIRKWAAGGGNVKPDTVAKSQKALAQWELLKSKSKAKTLARKLDSSKK